MTDAPRRRFRLLAAVSGGPRAARIAGEAVALARRIGADLHLLHAGRGEPAARERLLALARDAGAADPPTLHLRPGPTHEVVRAVAEEMEAGLVLIGALERESLWRELFGSSARRIARSVRRPILLLTAPRAEGSPFLHFALTARPDDPTAAALAYLLPFLQAEGADLQLLHERDYYDRLAGRLAGAGSSAADPATVATDSRLELERFLEGIDFGSVPARVVDLAEGEALASVDYVRRHGLDVLVCPAPSRPMTLWDRFSSHPLEMVLASLPPALLIFRRLPARPQGPAAAPATDGPGGA